jgi:hypothetical protein
MAFKNMSISSLLRTHPWAEEVLEWHGVDVMEVERYLSLGALCWLKNLDLSRVVLDLIAAQPDEVDSYVSDILLDDRTLARNDWNDFDETQVMRRELKDSGEMDPEGSISSGTESRREVRVAVQQHGELPPAVLREAVRITAEMDPVTDIAVVTGSHPPQSQS